MKVKGIKRIFGVIAVISSFFLFGVGVVSAEGYKFTVATESALITSDVYGTYGECESARQAYEAGSPYATNPCTSSLTPPGTSPAPTQTAPVTDLKSLVDYLIRSLIAPLFGIFLAAAIVFLMWNILMVIKNSDQPEELAKFKSKVVWGIIAVAVMISMWGLVNFITGSLKLNTSSSINLDRFGQPL